MSCKQEQQTVDKRPSSTTKTKHQRVVANEQGQHSERKIFLGPKMRKQIVRVMKLSLERNQDQAKRKNSQRTVPNQHNQARQQTSIHQVPLSKVVIAIHDHIIPRQQGCDPGYEYPDGTGFRNSRPMAVPIPAVQGKQRQRQNWQPENSHPSAKRRCNPNLLVRLFW